MWNFKSLNSKKHFDRSAFSLIELSIVLIIIGLLIAGVTGGASLIKSAELRSVMNEARGYNVAVNSFYTQFDDLPGDYDVDVTTLTGDPVGDSDDVIEYINNASTTSYVEGVLAWAQLQDTNVIDTTLAFTNTDFDLAAAAATGALVADVDVPSSRVKGSAWVFDNGSINSETKSMLILTNTPVETVTNTAATTSYHFIAAGATVANYSIMTPSDLLSIDTKMDDGVGDTGSVVDFLYINDTGTQTGCNDGTDYQTATTTNQCVPGFVIDVLG